MKQKINIILGFLLFSICIYGQEKPVYTIASLNVLESRATTSSGNIACPVPFSYKLTPEWKTHKKCQAWGWTALGTGTIMMMYGFWALCMERDEVPKSTPKYVALAYGGVAITAASVPLFVFSIKNKNKARSLKLGTGTLAAPLRNGSGMAYTTGMSIGISF